MGRILGSAQIKAFGWYMRTADYLSGAPVSPTLLTSSQIIGMHLLQLGSNKVSAWQQLQNEMTEGFFEARIFREMGVGGRDPPNLLNNLIAQS